jgi:hypothetical protein
MADPLPSASVNLATDFKPLIDRVRAPAHPLGNSRFAENFAVDIGQRFADRISSKLFLFDDGWFDYRPKQKRGPGRASGLTTNSHNVFLARFLFQILPSQF